MELQPIPDNILQRQVCTNCFQYLSVLPVTINKNGDIFCKRCKEALSTENTEHCKSLLFNTVARNYLFKCVNHYEGCKTLIDVNTALAHEATCEYENHECFFCSFNGNWCQIVNHCFKQHPKKMTQDGTFQFTVGNELQKRMVYVAKSCIFLYTINITKDTFFLNISPEAKNDFAINQFAVKFYLSSDPQSVSLLAIDYELFDINSVNILKKDMEYFVLNFGRKTVLCCQVILKQVKVSQKELELERRWLNIKSQEANLNQRSSAVNRRESLLKQQQETMNNLLTFLKQISPHFTCFNCHSLITETLYICLKIHFYCETCLSVKCKGCNKITEFAQVLEFNKIMVTCDWPNCQTSVSLSNYLKHKCHCLLRPYKCPLKDCLEIIYSHEKFEDHWHCRVPPLVTDYDVKFDKYDDYECYWLVNTELFHVVIRFSNTNLQIIIENVNVLSDGIKFTFSGLAYNTWQTINPVEFCGKHQVISNNISSSGYYFEAIKISVEDSLKDA